MSQRHAGDEVPEQQDASFGARLRSLREKAGLTQEELALRAGLSLNAVGGLERGTRKRPYPHTVRSLADALQLPEDRRAWLLEAVPGRGASSRRRTTPPPALAAPATPLLGRERELEELAGLLAPPEVRLVTLTGIGGVGKTRLALEAARRTAGLFADGVAFAALAALGDHGFVLPTIAQALGLRETHSRTPGEALHAHLREKRFLLVLDNVEHVLEAAPEVLSLVESCPKLTVLATSRAPLRVRGEREYPVPPLALPASTRSVGEREVLGSPSGRLFAQSARASTPTFEVTDENASSVAAICWRLAGLPLAIELAAARTRFLDPGALLSHLDRALSTAWMRDLPERQRTMRATLDWSHDLLSEKEKALFRRFSVFAGGFTLAAAEEVCASGGVEQEEMLDLLGRLVEQSLVTVRQGQDARARYGMLEPVRQYAREKLEESGEAAATRERHAGRFVAQAETARPDLMGPEYAARLKFLEQEHDNLREALLWAQEAGALETGLRLAGALCWFWWMHGYLSEGRRWVETFLSEDSRCGRPAPGLVRARALYGAGEMAFGQGDLARSAELLEESLALYRELGDEVGVAILLVETGQLARAQGDHDRATALSEEGLSLSRELGEQKVSALALNTLGQIERHRGNTEAAIDRYEESLAISRRIGHEWATAYTLASLGVAALERGELERASALSQESSALYEALGDRAGVALALINLGDVARRVGEEERATTLYEGALALQRELGNERGIARALDRLSAMS